MAQFRVVCADGTEHRFTARTMVSGGTGWEFKDRGETGLATIRQFSYAEVTEVSRTIMEVNGFVRWVNQPLKPAGTSGSRGEESRKYAS